MPAAARLIPMQPAPSEDAVTLAAAQARFADFNAAVARAEALYKRGKLEQASVHAAIAAMIAVPPHAGFSVSPRL